MSDRSIRRMHNRGWAPRALAVMSCALALMAAQPALGETAKAAREMPLILAQPAPASAAVVETRRETGKAAGTAWRGEQTFLSSARRLHILATVEIIKRLLISELQPTAQQMIVPALVLEPLDCVQRLAVDLTCQSSEAPPPYSPLPPPERRFVLEQFQLAPPIV